MFFPIASILAAFPWAALRNARSFQNSGNGPLRVYGFVASPGFVVTAVSDSTIAPHTAGTFTVQFVPQTTVPYQGVVRVRSNATQGDSVLTVAGTGTAPLVPRMGLEPDTLNFGDVPVTRHVSG